MKHLKRFLSLWAVLTLFMFAAGCDVNWVTSASDIVKLLIPAVAALLATLGTLGIPPSVLADWNTWSAKASSALTTVGELIAAYNTADASAQPGILGQIDSALNALLTQFQALLSEVNVTNPKTQALWTELATDFAAELEALLALIPVIKGEVTDHDEVLARVTQLKSAKKFKDGFNKKLAALAPGNKI
jgi:hypothetical protein